MTTIKNCVRIATWKYPCKVVIRVTDGERSVYLITSCKGGVGKSTVAVNLALTMALCGSVVLLADCDTKNRTADLMLGYDGVGMFDLSDVAYERVAPVEAVLRDPRCDRLYYCTVPPSGEVIDPARVTLAAVRCADAVDADCLMIDTSGGIDFPLAMYRDAVYDAIIISTQSMPALRAAERTGAELSQHGVKNLRLIINEYGKDGDSLPVNDIIDETRIPLLGVIPYDEAMRRGQELGMPAAAVEDSVSPQAFYNIAMRLRGADIPLFSGMRPRGLRSRRKRYSLPSEDDPYIL